MPTDLDGIIGQLRFGFAPANSSANGSVRAHLVRPPNQLSVVLDVFALGGDMDTWLVWRQGDRDTREIPMPYCLANRVPYRMNAHIEWLVTVRISR